MSGHPFNSYQRIPEISTKETKYEQISCKPFFLHEENWETELFLSKMSSKNFTTFA